MFFSNGPNSAVGTTGINMMMEHQVQYAVMCAMKLQRERLKSIEPKAEAITDFEKYMEVSVFLELACLKRLHGSDRIGLFQEGPSHRWGGDILNISLTINIECVVGVCSILV